jgi:hypothetical protein
MYNGALFHESHRGNDWLATHADDIDTLVGRWSGSNLVLVHPYETDRVKLGLALAFHHSGRVNWCGDDHHGGN